MSTYHERRHQAGKQRRRQSGRRRLKKARLVCVVLGVLCLVIGAIIFLVSFFVSDESSRRWLIFGAGYVAGGLGFFVFRLLLFGYEKLDKAIERGRSKA